jgi:hypothetical protein
VLVELDDLPFDGEEHLDDVKEVLGTIGIYEISKR